MIPTLMGKCQIYYLMTENITNLHHLHLLAAVVFSCFKVPTKVHGLELLKNYLSIFKNSPAKHTTFKLMIWWTTQRKKYRFFFLKILWTLFGGKFKKYHHDYWDLGEYEKVFWMTSVAKEFFTAWQEICWNTKVS